MEAVNHSLQARQKFEKHFPKPHSFITSLHAKNLSHALEGAKISFENGADGAALVTHAIEDPFEAIKIVDTIKQRYPEKQALLNVLGVDPLSIFKALHNSKVQLDGLWTDNAGVHGVDLGNFSTEDYADKVLEQQNKMNWDGVYFGPVNFKHQAQFAPEQLGIPIGKTRKYLDVMTTSGPRTGVAADPKIVELIKMIAGQHPVMLASGVTPENIHDYINNIDAAMVATWISKDYWNLDPIKVAELSEIMTKYNRLKAQ